MNGETARILALAFVLRDKAVTSLKDLHEYGAASSPEAVGLAQVFVHEQRIINRIISEERDMLE